MTGRKDRIETGYYIRNLEVPESGYTERSLTDETLVVQTIQCLGIEKERSLKGK